MSMNLFLPTRKRQMKTRNSFIVLSIILILITESNEAQGGLIGANLSGTLLNKFTHKSKPFAPSTAVISNTSREFQVNEYSRNNTVIDAFADFSDSTVTVGFENVGDSLVSNGGPYRFIFENIEFTNPNEKITGISFLQSGGNGLWMDSPSTWIIQIVENSIIIDTENFAGSIGDGFVLYVSQCVSATFEIHTIPEPATMGLLAIGALALVRKRRK